LAEVFEIGAGSRFRRHSHESTHLLVVLGGGLVEHGTRGSRDLAPGTVRLSPPMRHDLDFGPRGARCLVLEVEAGQVAPLERSLFLAGDARLAGLGMALAGALARDASGGSLSADGLVEELLAQVERHRSGRALAPPPWLRLVRELIHDQRGLVRVAELSARAGVHRVHLARAFRDHFGSSVSRYARRVRVERAAHLIETSGMPLASVAAATGFADQAHLTRTLRQALGTTPGALRSAAATSIASTEPPGRLPADLAG